MTTRDVASSHAGREATSQQAAPPPRPQLRGRGRGAPPCVSAAVPPQDARPRQLSLFMTVRLACGHAAEIPASKSYKPGDWVSCWAVMHPQNGCQTQRKVIEVVRSVTA